MTTASQTNSKEAQALASPPAFNPPGNNRTGNKELDDLLRQIAADDSSSEEGGVGGRRHGDDDDSDDDDDNSSSSSSERGGRVVVVQQTVPRKTSKPEPPATGGRRQPRPRGRSRGSRPRRPRANSASSAEEEAQRKVSLQSQKEMEQMMERHGVKLRRQSSLDRQAKIEDGQNDAVHIRSLLQRASVDQSGDARANLKYQHMDGSPVYLRDGTGSYHQKQQPEQQQQQLEQQQELQAKVSADNTAKFNSERTVKKDNKSPPNSPPPIRTVNAKKPVRIRDPDDDPNQVSDLELGYEDIATDHQGLTSPLNTPPMTNNNGKGSATQEEGDKENTEDDDGNLNKATTLAEGEEEEDCEKKEEDEEEELPLWERIPLGLAIAMGLFGCSFLGSTWMIWSYLLLSGYGIVGTLFVVSSIAGGFLGSGYIIVNTFLYTHMDLEHALDQQDKARAILSNVYPEHILQRLLPDLDKGEDDSEEEDNSQQQEDIEDPTELAGTIDKQDGEQTSLLNPNNRMDRSYGTTTAARRSRSDDVSVLSHDLQSYHSHANTDHLQLRRIGTNGSTASPPPPPPPPPPSALPPTQLRVLNKHKQRTQPERIIALAERMEKMKKSINSPGALKRRNSMSKTLETISKRLTTPIGPRAAARRMSGSHQSHFGGSPAGGERRRGSVAGGSSAGGGSHSPGNGCKHQSDLFPNTTVFHAEIVGFTAWSSQRSPNQVFELLQRVFSDMDVHAQRGGVFKVESFGESYIAVTGLPEPDPDHAVRMAKFASDCLSVFSDTTSILERTLGPDTGELQLRIGLNSGPVTAGVLRGDKSRFQLFGNTVNNAVRAEKQGKGNRVHVTRETYELLLGAGKGHWMEAREPSEAGKTFWLVAAEKNERRASCSSYAKLELEMPEDGLEEASQHNSDGALLPPGSVVPDDRSVGNMSHISDATGIQTVGSIGNGTVDSKKTWTMQDILTAKEQRLIEWTVDQLALMLQKILARRAAVERYEIRMGLAPPKSDEPPTGLYYQPQDHNETVLDEVQEMVVIPHYNNKMVLEEAIRGGKAIELPERALEELTNYVSTVTTFYYDQSRNPFHNFMHASHVLMSVVKMMQRIISPTQAAMEKEKKQWEEAAEDDDKSVASAGTRGSIATLRRRRVKRTISWEDLHDHTFGITTDPLTQFAVVFAALIHDLDHPGVPNAQLVKEETRLARIYKNRSISEQNSLDMAWDLLMDPSYQNLVRSICGSQEELKRFRQLLVQTVMATDIADAELRADRNARWEKAFAKKPKSSPFTKKKAEKKPGDNNNNTADDDSSVATEATNATSLSTTNDDASATGGSPTMREDNGSGTGRRIRSQETEDDKNRKATIVLEHLLQASDIAHTMQHWEVFRKWNEKLYREMYLAYLHGRAEKDPVEFWYKGEIGFFKFYIIPLAKKLSDCGVFGVSSDEYLNYAEQNLEIWESKGMDVVKEVSAAAYRDFGTKEDPKIEGLRK